MLGEHKNILYRQGFDDGFVEGLARAQNKAIDSVIADTFHLTDSDKKRNLDELTRWLDDLLEDAK